MLKISKKEILRLPTAISAENADLPILRSASAISAPIALESWQTPTNKLFNNLSATHLLYLSNIQEPLKRAFYEHEAIIGCWTVKELDRQVSSLYYERMGFSKNKQLLHQKALSKAQLQPQDIIRDPVTLEFLKLPESAAYTETKLETAILNNLQQFYIGDG